MLLTQSPSTNDGCYFMAGLWSGYTAVHGHSVMASSFGVQLIKATSLARRREQVTELI